MTTINSQEDFLRALADHPEWRAAVRAQILGEELLRLPERLNSFIERMDSFVEEQRHTNEEQRRTNEEQRRTNDRLDSSIEELRRANEEQKRANDEQKRTNDRLDSSIDELKRTNAEIRRILASHDRRINRMSDDIAQVKGSHARLAATENAEVIIFQMGLGYTRTLPRIELARMAGKLAGNGNLTDELRSFSEADLVIEATDETGETCFVAAEASFRANKYDAGRALRNARLLTEFTGTPARAVIVSVHNDRNARAKVASGEVHWHRVMPRELEPA